MRRSNGVLAFVGFGIAAAGAAAVGSLYGPRDWRTRLWYRRLDKPSFTPPNRVFPIVWTFLYSLMAVSGWRVWQRPESAERSAALRLWVSQLMANAEWSKLFFGKHLPTWSLAQIITLQSAVIGYMLEARKVDRTAATLFIPYAAWIGFAALLNEEIARRNPNAAKMFPRAKVA